MCENNCFQSKRINFFLFFLNLLKYSDFRGRKSRNCSVEPTDTYFYVNITLNMNSQTKLNAN